MGLRHCGTLWGAGGGRTYGEEEAGALSSMWSALQRFGLFLHLLVSENLVGIGGASASASGRGLILRLAPSGPLVFPGKFPSTSGSWLGALVGDAWWSLARVREDRGQGSGVLAGSVSGGLETKA